MIIHHPAIALHPDPQGIDKAIRTLQIAFTQGVDWLEIAFGRSFKAWRKEPDGRQYAFPEVYKGNGDYFNVFPNDTYQSYLFFSHKDAAKAITDPGYVAGAFNEWEHQVDIIVWFNYNKVGDSLNYPIVETKLADILSVLGGYPTYKVDSIYYDADNVFQGYDINYVKEQYLRYPFGGFRISGRLTYLEGECQPFDGVLCDYDGIYLVDSDNKGLFIKQNQ